MATWGLMEYQDGCPKVRTVYDHIMAIRKVDWTNNFWKALAHDPATRRSQVAGRRSTCETCDLEPYLFTRL